MLRLSTGSFSFSPTRPVPLAGYRHRSAPYQEVRDDLEAVFLRLSDENGSEVVLGSFDTLLPRWHGPAIRLFGRTGPVYTDLGRASDGGYEVEEFQRHFGLDGEFHPDISGLVVSAAARLFDPDMAMA
jgi:hypothetical protein